MRLTDMRELGFPSEIRTVQVAELLRERYPEQLWDKIYLLKGRHALQKRLEKAVATLFPVLTFNSISVLSPLN